VVALPWVDQQAGRQARTGGQPAVGRYHVAVQVDDGPVLGRVGGHLLGGHVQSRAAQRVQRVPVDHRLLHRGQVGAAGQERFASVGRRLGGPGAGEVGYAVGQLSGEALAGVAEAQRAHQRGRVGVSADGQAGRRGRERLGRGGRTGQVPATAEGQGQFTAGDAAACDADHRFAGQRAPQATEDGRSRAVELAGDGLVVDRGEVGAHTGQYGAIIS
jgi:hypothetical protein